MLEVWPVDNPGAVSDDAVSAGGGGAASSPLEKQGNSCHSSIKPRSLDRDASRCLSKIVAAATAAEKEDEE